MRRRIAVLVPLALLVLSPIPAIAQTDEPQPTDQVVLRGDAVVPRGTVVGEVVVFSGSARIEGVAQGDVVVLDGPVTIAGQVGGDVVGLHGPIHLLRTAQVGGNVLAGDDVAVADGAQVGGTIRHGVRFTLAGPAATLGALVASAAVATSILLVLLVWLLLAPRGLERVAEAGHESPGPSIGWGLLVVVAVPVVALAAAASILGMPLGLAVLLATGLLWLLGLAAVSFLIGRLLVRPPRSRVGALFAGFGVSAAVGLVPILNVAWWILGAAYGLGAIVVATWRSRHGVPLVPGGRGGHHRVGLRGSMPAPVAAEPVGERPSDMPLAED